MSDERIIPDESVKFMIASDGGAYMEMFCLKPDGSMYFGGERVEVPEGTAVCEGWRCWKGSA